MLQSSVSSPSPRDDKAECTVNVMRMQRTAKAMTGGCGCPAGSPEIGGCPRPVEDQRSSRVDDHRLIVKLGVSNPTNQRIWCPFGRQSLPQDTTIGAHDMSAFSGAAMSSRCTAPDLFAHPDSESMQSRITHPRWECDIAQRPGPLCSPCRITHIVLCIPEWGAQGR
jgi:hypothetical protein